MRADGRGRVCGAVAAPRLCAELPPGAGRLNIRQPPAHAGARRAHPGWPRCTQRRWHRHGRWPSHASVRLRAGWGQACWSAVGSARHTTRGWCCAQAAQPPKAAGLLPHEIPTRGSAQGLRAADMLPVAVAGPQRAEQHPCVVDTAAKPVIAACRPAATAVLRSCSAAKSPPCAKAPHLEQTVHTTHRELQAGTRGARSGLLLVLRALVDATRGHGALGTLAREALWWWAWQRGRVAVSQRRCTGITTGPPRARTLAPLPLMVADFGVGKRWRCGGMALAPLACAIELDGRQASGRQAACKTRRLGAMEQPINVLELFWWYAGARAGAASAGLCRPRRLPTAAAARLCLAALRPHADSSTVPRTWDACR